jgi:hypothetical protein
MTMHPDTMFALVQQRQADLLCEASLRRRVARAMRARYRRS